MTRLLASASSLEALQPLIERFYYGTKIQIAENGSIIRVIDNKLLTGVKVTQKGRRFRFEMEGPNN